MKEQTKKILLWALDLVVNLAVILVLVLVIQKWIIAPFDVSGASMCNTLNEIDGECHNGYGEKIIINEATLAFNKPERGDIVVFKAPGQKDKYFIKRVIGLPGETVEIRGGKVYVTDSEKKSFELDEKYLNEDNRNNTRSYFDNLTVFEVPKEHYFLLGDNRQASTDSRSCFQSSVSKDCVEHSENAYVPEKSIRGKAWVVWWPLKNVRIIEHVDY